MRGPCGKLRLSAQIGTLAADAPPPHLPCRASSPRWGEEGPASGVGSSAPQILTVIDILSTSSPLPLLPSGRRWPNGPDEGASRQAPSLGTDRDLCRCRTTPSSALPGIFSPLGRRGARVGRRRYALRNSHGTNSPLPLLPSGRRWPNGPDEGAPRQAPSVGTDRNLRRCRTAPSSALSGLFSPRGEEGAASAIRALQILTAIDILSTSSPPSPSPLGEKVPEGRMRGGACCSLSAR
jgi:hypothetical protein